MNNSIEVKETVVTKTFSSRMNYARELGIYKKLQGTDLAPELISDYDGCIEHAYVEGPDFMRCLSDVEGKPAGKAKLFEIFFTWYREYWKRTHQVLGKLDLSKFILAKDGLKYFDFEHCKPGHLESDIARAAASLCMVPKPYSESGIETARLFICVGASFLDWRGELLAEYLESELAEMSAGEDITGSSVLRGYVTRLFTSAGVVFSGRNEPSAATSLLSAMPQRFICCREEGGEGCPGFVPVPYAGNDVVAVRDILKDVKQPWCVILRDGEPVCSKGMLRSILSAPDKDADVIMYTAGGDVLTSVMLLRTEVVEEALRGADESRPLIETLNSLVSVKTIRYENMI